MCRTCTSLVAVAVLFMISFFRWFLRATLVGWSLKSWSGLLLALFIFRKFSVLACKRTLDCADSSSCSQLSRRHLPASQPGYFHKWPHCPCHRTCKRTLCSRLVQLLRYLPKYFR